MREKLRTYALKTTALLGLFSIIYPAINTVRALIFEVLGGWSCLLLAFIFTTAGFLAASVIVGDKSPIFMKLASSPAIEFILGDRATSRFLSGLSVHIAVFIPIGVSLLIFQKSGPVRLVFEAVSAVVFYMAGVRANYKDYDEILDRQRMYAGFIVLTAVAIVCSFKEIRMNSILYAYILTVTSMVVANQAKIDRVFLYMNRHLAGVSKDIRKFNVLSVLLLVGVTFLFLYFRDIMEFCLNVLNNLIRSGAALFFKLLASLFRSVPEKGYEQQPQALPPLQLMGEGGNNPYVNMIFNILFAIALAFAGYKLLPVFVKAVFKAIKNILRKIWAYILNIMERTNREEPETDEYNDEVEEIRRPGKALKKSRKMNYARLKRTLKGLRRLSDPVEKVRYIYGIILDMLNILETGIGKSDTPRDVCKKAELKGIHISYIIDLYEKVRYGERIPDGDEVAMAEECCSEVVRQFSK